MSARSRKATPRKGEKDSKERVSPLSPTRLSRLQEKEQLQSLNDRLAAYIDKVRQLELENNRLNLQVETIQESVSKEVFSMKSLYEAEITDARKLLDETAKDKAQLQIDIGKLKSSNEDLKLRLSRKERDLSAVEKALSSAEGQIADLTAKLSASENDRKKLLGEVKDLRDEVKKLSRQLAEAKEQLESETLMRVDLENRNQSLREELQFKQQVYEQEVTETKKRKQVEISELDSKFQVEYEAKLKDSLQELRASYEDELRSNRTDVEELYEAKIEELSQKNTKSSEEFDALTSSLRETKREAQELTSRLSFLEGTNQSLEQRVADLERQLERERDNHSLELSELKTELREREREREEQLREYQDLLDLKIALDLEIAAYRKLLEAEEERLHMTPASKTPATPSTSRGVGRRTPLRAGVKRKRELLEEEVSQKYSSKSQCSGDLEICEDCPEGKFVRIKNNSEKDLSLGGYQVMREVDGEVKTTYKFHSKAKIPGGSVVSIFSCNCVGQVHEPPRSIVMKNQVWATGDAMMTRLVAASEEVASRESKRERETTTSYIGGEDIPGSKDASSQLYTGCVLA